MVKGSSRMDKQNTGNDLIIISSTSKHYYFNTILFLSTLIMNVSLQVMLEIAKALLR